MKTAITTIKATDVALDLIHKKADGAPIGWAASIVEKVKERVPEQERESIKVFGMEGLSFTYEHILTKDEELAERLAVLEVRIERARALLGRPGSALSDAALQDLRNALA